MKIPDDASCTMVRIGSCVMHDYFVGEIIIFELRTGYGCQKSRQETDLKLCDV